MRNRPFVPKPAQAGAILGIAALCLSGCVQLGTTDNVEDFMGNASAAKSPAATNPAGEVVEIPGAEKNVIDMESVGDSIAVRTKDRVYVGSAKDFLDEKATEIEINAECGDLTPSADAFVLACQDGVYLIDPEKPALDKAAGDANYKTAVKTSSGKILAARRDGRELDMFRDGELEKTIKLERPADQMLALKSPDGEDSIIYANEQYTLIQQVNLEKETAGAMLRVGKGVGQITGSDQEIMAASDNTGGMLMLYMTDDVVRLQKAYPVANSPWAVAWDNKREYEWVSTTADNKLSSYSQADGDMTLEDSIDTIADVHNIVFVEDYSILVAASASGDGLQIISLNNSTE